MVIVDGLLGGSGVRDSQGALFYMEQLVGVEKRIGDILSLIVIQSETTNIQEEDVYFKEIANETSGRRG